MSNLDFKLGAEKNPKGHAIIYFEEFDEIYAAYVMDFPITGDLSKYIPEMFKDQIPDEEMTKMIFPPVPEKYNGDLESLIKLSENRSDDLIYGGSINPKDSSQAMSKLNQLANEYSNLCSETKYGNLNSIIEDIPKSSILENQSNYSAMGESELLSEITKLIGKIKFSKDSDDKNEIFDYKCEIKEIGTLIPENRKITDLLEHVDLDMEKSEEIISAYISRAYSMLNEDYIKVKEFEDLILDLENKNLEK